MGGSKTSYSETKTEPWSEQQPYLKDIYSRAQKFYGYSKPIYEIQETVTWKPRYRNSDELTLAQRNEWLQSGLSLDEWQKNKGLGTGEKSYQQVQTGTEWVPGELTLEYYPGETVAGFTPEQIQGQELTTNRALLGSTLDKAGKAYMEDVIGGKYVTPESNPYLKYYVDKAYENVLPQLDTTAIQAGRYGSGAWGSQKSDAMSDINSQIYGGAYNTERGYQQAAAMVAPEIAQTDYLDYDRLLSVGAEKQALEQAKMDAAKEKFEFEQMAPWQQLAMYANIISGNLGGETTAYTSGGK